MTTRCSPLLEQRPGCRRIVSPAKRSRTNSGNTRSASPRKTTSTQGNARCSASPIGPSQLLPPKTICNDGSCDLRSFAKTSEGTFWLNVVVKPTTLGGRREDFLGAALEERGNEPAHLDCF